MTTNMDVRAYKRKVPKWLPFKNYKSDLLKKKSNQHKLGTYIYIYIYIYMYIYIYIYTKEQVCMTIYNKLSIDSKP